jgi:hypothetical protein
MHVDADCSKRTLYAHRVVVREQFVRTMAVSTPVRYAVAVIYCLYYVAIAAALPLEASGILVGIAASHLVVGGATATRDTDGPIEASRARYSVKSKGTAALAAIAADTLLLVSLATSLGHVLAEHAPIGLFYAGWATALLGNTACLVTHYHEFAVTRASVPIKFELVPMTTTLV